jgi:hypothetical protein
MSNTFNAGAMFARSEIDAAESFEVFARAVGPTPTYEVWQAERINFVNGYVSIKPHAKGDSADKAFQRFKDRVVQAFEIVVPKSDNTAATKKAAERKAKDAKLLEKHSSATPTMLRAQLEAAYQTLAKQPDSKVANALVNEYKKVLKLKTRDEDKAERGEVKAIKDEIREAMKDATLAQLEAALAALR